MPSLLFGLSLAAVFSITSLLVILFRVSPLTAPGQAIPAFFLSFFLTIASVSALLFMALWKSLPFHHWDTGKIMSVSLRQGLLLAVATNLIVLFFLLKLLTWWIGLLIFAMFILVEVAMEQ